ncbi:YIP1 family protein [Alkalihalobacillus trypoxylicola]|uniref:Yip1 domain-containing protein n=1 Tax=Alkalihalobacillus trypoxylicola TaxID=519424 RepID=A0A161P7B6_9BACI|nr:YIP1 family protein [Alkalihalobacillus trypoxylicola]KYG26971.1 hypothetical protein AZF04_11570 [Alkalihalobacillus trypoxylicola]GAF66601.1 putative MFS transporter [Bacillus sp. TS-2]
MNNQHVKYPLHLTVHPFEGFWDLKYERSVRTNLIISFVILFLLIMTNVLSSQYSGFVVNLYNPEEMNSLLEVIYVLIPILFWCVANWSLTTLMDGEGKFVEIFISTCFSLTPLIIINFPWIWLSNFISLQEATFFYFSQSIAIIWFLFLLFIGNMTVHQFTPSKTVLTIFLTVIAIFFMAFLCLLFFSLIQQIVAFISVIYQEIVFRY